MSKGGSLIRVAENARAEVDGAEEELTRGWKSHGSMEFHDSSRANELHYGSARDEIGLSRDLGPRLCGLRALGTVGSAKDSRGAKQMSGSCVGCVSLIAIVVH